MHINYNFRPLDPHHTPLTDLGTLDTFGATAMQSAGLLCDGVLMHRALSGASIAVARQQQLQQRGHDTKEAELQQRIREVSAEKSTLVAANTDYETQMRTQQQEIARLSHLLSAAETKLEAERYRTSAKEWLEYLEYLNTKIKVIFGGRISIKRQIQTV